MHLRKIFVLLLLSAFSVSSFAKEFKADDIVGFWLSEKKTAVIEIYKNKKEFKGKIVWLKDIHDGKIKDKLDEKNPDEDKRKRSLVGMINLHSFQFDDGKWVDGKIYDPESGKTYSAKMEMKSDTKLDLRGYIGVPMFGRTSSWSKQKSQVPDSYNQK